MYEKDYGSYQNPCRDVAIPRLWTHTAIQQRYLFDSAIAERV